MAVAFSTSCRSTPDARNCVDQNNRIVGDQQCYTAEEDYRRGTIGYRPYRWVYNGSSGGHIGDAVFNGSPVPASRGFFGGGGVGGGVERGGFGSSFGSSS